MQKGMMFIGTLNNPDTTDMDGWLKGWLSNAGACFATGQLEKGEQGTVHLQYFIHMKKQTRVSALKKYCPKSHFEVVKKDNGAEEYCNKEETRVEGPWSHGVRPARLDKKGDLARRNQELIELGAEAAVKEGVIDITKYLVVKKAIDSYKIATMPAHEHDTVRGLWIWGPPGVGKSHKARHDYEDIYLKPQSKWFDGYTGQKTILMDDHDNGCLGHFLKIWADHYACTGETKGGTVPLHHTLFIVTSNYSIEELYGSAGVEMVKAIERRFKVIHMTAPFQA